MEVIMVDGQRYLGNVAKNKNIEEAIFIGGNLGDVLNKKDISNYFTAQNLDELIKVDVSSNNTSIITRRLAAEENMLVTMAIFNMETAKTKALQTLENQYFVRAFEKN